jgi:hypothetical protein
MYKLLFMGKNEKKNAKMQQQKNAKMQQKFQN